MKSAKLIQFPRSFILAHVLFFFVGFAISFSQDAKAYYTTGESGELVQAGNYNLGVEPQIKLSNGSGFNFGGFIDAPVGSASSIRGQIGFGVTDFFTSLSYKWIPYPDYQNQPAMGLKFEALYARVGGDPATGIKVHPLISKIYDVKFGRIIPYGSIPLGLSNTSAGTDTSVQVVVGSELLLPNLANWKFSAEVGLNTNKSFSYISGSLIYILQDSKPKPIY